MKALIILFAIITSFGKPIGFNKPQEINNLTFEKRISIIHSRVVDLTDIFALHHIKEFNEVYDRPIVFKDSVVYYLRGTHTFEEKIIAICSMTKLPLDQYVSILNAYYKLYCKHEINEMLLSRGIFNEFDVDNRLEREYKDSSVNTLLNKMIANKHISKQFRHDLQETLSGRRLNAIKQFKNTH